MTICVMNCFHWIGFHIVNRLTENGYNVDGIANSSSDREEELSFMLGRNSSFTLYQSENEVKDRQYSDAVLVHPERKPSPVQSLKTYNFGKAIDDPNPNFTNIDLPMLFGEWMPMDEQGAYIDGQYIEFDSTRFRESAIYIDDFVDCFMQWMKVPDLPRSISLTKNRDQEIGEESLEKQLYIRENRPIEIQVSNLLKHYEKVKNFTL